MGVFSRDTNSIAQKAHIARHPNKGTDLLRNISYGVNTITVNEKTG
jgi:hypothetical protein